jgi:hypothetical protein
MMVIYDHFWLGLMPMVESMCVYQHGASGANYVNYLLANFMSCYIYIWFDAMLVYNLACIAKIYLDLIFPCSYFAYIDDSF